MMRVEVEVVCVWEGASLAATRALTAAAGPTKTLRRRTLTAHGAACEAHDTRITRGGGACVVGMMSLRQIEDSAQDSM